MDFKDLIKQVAERIEKLSDSLQTEEATKNALIMPFIQTLGYDVFNPHEVLPEMICDIGIKKGEKIDYAIMKDGQPIILIECKHWKKDLNLHDNQLLRYYHASKAKFGILTNGIIYRFYTDLETPNKMDETPFLEINLLELEDNNIEELKKFHKSYFDIDTILDSASELKYTGELKKIIAKEFSNPTAEFVKFFGKQVYDGLFNQKVLEQFTPIVKKSISSYIKDIISARLKTAIKAEEENDIETSDKNNETLKSQESKIVTTEEEKESFYIVKSVLRNTLDSERITFRDSQSYFAVFADDNNRKTICRIYLNSENNKMISFLDEDKKETKYKISTIDEIYNYSERLVEAAKKFT